MTLTSKDGKLTFDINESSIDITITDSTKDVVYYIMNGGKTIAKKKDESGNEYGEMIGSYSALN